MGFVRKVMGVQGQIDATKDNANAQIAATQQAANAQQQNLMQNAKAAADQQAMLSARMAVESKVSDQLSQPIGTAEVQIDGDSTDSVTATRRKAKAAFGREYSSGVQI